MSGWPFVLTITVLEAGAVAGYAFQRRWPEALYWFAATLINVAFLWKVGA